MLIEHKICTFHVYSMPVQHAPVNGSTGGEAGYGASPSRTTSCFFVFQCTKGRRASIWALLT